LKNFRKDLGRKWRQLARLEHNGATRQQCGSNLANDLVHRPIPRRNQRTHTHRFLNYQRGALLFLKWKILGERECGLQVPQSERSLHRTRNRVQRRAHLFTDRDREIIDALGIDPRDGTDQIHAFLKCDARISAKRAMRSVNRTNYVAFVA